MVGVADVLPAVVRAEVGGDECFVMIEEELVGVDFEGELLGSVEMWHGVTVGLEDHPAATVSTGRADGRAIVGHGGQRLGGELFLGKGFGGFAAGFSVAGRIRDS